MAFISLIFIEILALIVFTNLVIGILLGIIGLIMQIKNRIDIKKGKNVSKIRKILSLIFCILGAISIIIVVVLELVFPMFLQVSIDLFTAIITVLFQPSS